MAAAAAAAAAAGAAQPQGQPQPSELYNVSCANSVITNACPTQCLILMKHHITC